MSRWTDQELRELVTLWPTNSASQIAKQLHRRRSAICRKASSCGRRDCYRTILPRISTVSVKGRPQAELTP